MTDDKGDEIIAVELKSFFSISSVAFFILNFSLQIYLSSLFDIKILEFSIYYTPLMRGSTPE
jgi:hypothetical protein